MISLFLKNKTKKVLHNQVIYNQYIIWWEKVNSTKNHSKNAVVFFKQGW